MSIKDRIKGAWNKLRNKSADGKVDARKNLVDAEISAEEVVKEEIFPSGRKTASRGKQIAADKKQCKKSACAAKAKKPTQKKTAVTDKSKKKRTRPTNPSYTMIDVDDNTCDSGKS